MANTFSPTLQKIFFAAAAIIPTELTGFAGAVMQDFNDQGVEEGGTVRVPIIPKATVGSIPAPSMSFVAGTDRTGSGIDFTLAQTAEVSWNMSAKDEQTLENSGTAQDVFKQTMEQNFRALRNQIESYLALVAKNAACRAIGTAGSAPFASDFNFLADMRKVMDDNGAPPSQTVVMNTTASNGLRKLAALFKVNESGTEDLLRNGVLGRLHNFDLRESAGVVSHTKGTMTTALVNSAALVIGSTTIPYDGGTPGATGIVAGDVITIAGDTNKYVVKTGPGAAAAGNIVIQSPGLLIAPADNAAIAVGNTYTGNIALSKSAIALVVRPDLQPDSPEIQQQVVTDSVTGFSYLVVRKVGSRMASWYMRSIYDAVAVNPYAINTLLG
jgi:hypothetical protein